MFGINSHSLIFLNQIKLKKKNVNISFNSFLASIKYILIQGISRSSTHIQLQFIVITGHAVPQMYLFPGNISVLFMTWPKIRKKQIAPAVAVLDAMA